MQIDINKIFEMLNCNNDDEIQLEGRNEAKKIKYISMFFQPIESKLVWENCAKILVEKQDEELKLYLIKLFEWLQDINWPGALLVYDRIRLMSSNFICDAFSYCLKVAVETNDYSWLSCLRSFSDNKELVSLLSEEHRKILSDVNY